MSLKYLLVSTFLLQSALAFPHGRRQSPDACSDSSRRSLIKEAAVRLADMMIDVYPEGENEVSVDLLCKIYYVNVINFFMGLLFLLL